MTGRRRVPLAAALAASIALLARAETTKADPPPPKDVVEIADAPGARSIHATVAGTIAGAATPRRPGGRREILLLVAPPRKDALGPAKPEADETSPCDEKSGAARDDSRTPRRLVRLDPAGDGALVVLRDDLPPDALELVAADLDGDGADEILVPTATGVDVLRCDAGGRWATERPRQGGPSVGVVGTLEPGPLRIGPGKPDAVSLATLGALRAYGIGPDGAWKTLLEAELPLDAKRRPWGLELSSPPVRRLESPGGVDLAVTDPETRGPDRLRSIVLRPGAPEAERRMESYAKLPGPERLLESLTLILDGRPAIAVTTMPAGKLSFFGEKLLRVFFLESDRTRLGKAPVLAVESHANLWQESHVVATDLNGDGRQDVVFSYWKGIKDSTVVLDAYLRRSDGTFEKSPRTTSFDVEEGDRELLVYGHDLDGAGLPDLLVVSGGRLGLHPGASASDGRKLVDEKARWSVPLPFEHASGTEISVSLGAGGAGMETRATSAASPTPVDLDGDGRMEILLLGGGHDGTSHAVVIVPAR